jgi:hypothetical protein
LMFGHRRHKKTASGGWRFRDVLESDPQIGHIPSAAGARG